MPPLPPLLRNRCVYKHFYLCRIEWHPISDSEAKQIYFPIIRALNTKDVKEVKPSGRNEADYHWFRFPHYQEFKQYLQVFNWVLTVSTLFEPHS